MSIENDESTKNKKNEIIINLLDLKFQSKLFICPWSQSLELRENDANIFHRGLCHVIRINIGNPPCDTICQMTTAVAHTSLAWVYSFVNQVSGEKLLKELVTCRNNKMDSVEIQVQSCFFSHSLAAISNLENITLVSNLRSRTYRRRHTYCIDLFGSWRMMEQGIVI